ARECPGKQEWPELVGEYGYKAAAIIERENPNVRDIVKHERSYGFTKDFRCDRVWVVVDYTGVVVRTYPRVT
uniref:Trypsin inhibitor (Fragments) n=1 Tax=Amaranthus hypochondriacus TaxID=28502 RepID=Q7M1Q2_AMAHP